MDKYTNAIQELKVKQGQSEEKLEKLKINKKETEEEIGKSENLRKVIEKELKEQKEKLHILQNYKEIIANEIFNSWCIGGLTSVAIWALFCIISKEITGSFSITPYLEIVHTIPLTLLNVILSVGVGRIIYNNSTINIKKIKEENEVEDLEESITALENKLENLIINIRNNKIYLGRLNDQLDDLEEVLENIYNALNILDQNRKEKKNEIISELLIDELENELNESWDNDEKSQDVMRLIREKDNRKDENYGY